MSPLPPSIQAVIELFQGPLAEVRFADVDAAALTNLARAAETAAADLAAHEAQLNELRQTAADRQEALLLLAQRGLAYARVYAENDEALSEQLSSINLSRPSKPRKVSSKAASSESTSSESASSESASSESMSSESTSSEPAARASAASRSGEASEVTASTVEAEDRAASALDDSAPQQATRRSKAQSRQRHSEAS